MGNLLKPGDLKIFLIVSNVFKRISGGLMSIFVTTTKNGIFKIRAIPRCSQVIRDTPMLAPTTIIA